MFAALVVLAAQLTTNMAANVVSPSNDFSNLNPRRISYVTGGLITAVIGILMMPWKLYSDAAAYIFTWLIGYSSLMGALGGILIADYWIVQTAAARSRRSVPGARRATPTRTASTGERSSRWCSRSLPVVPGFLRAATTPGGRSRIRHSSTGSTPMRGS